MKKLISAILAVTMLSVPLVNSACFADEAKNTDAQYTQTEKRSKPFQIQNIDWKKVGTILAGVAAGATTLTIATVAILSKLPKPIQEKLFFFNNKKEQEESQNKAENENVLTPPENTIENNNTADIKPVVQEKKSYTTPTASNHLNSTKKAPDIDPIASTAKSITQPTKINTTSNNIKPVTKNKVNASMVTPSITTNHTIYTNATNGSSNLNKTSENLLSSDTSGKTLTKTLIISAAAISALTAAVALAFLHPNLRNSFSQNFEKLKKECNKLGVTLGSSLKSLFSGTGKTQTTPGSKWTLGQVIDPTVIKDLDELERAQSTIDYINRIEIIDYINRIEIEVIDPTVIKDLDAAIKMAQNTIGHLNRIEEYAFNQPLTTSQQLADQLVAADLRVAAIDQVLQLFEYPNEQARSAAKLLFRKLGIEASRDAAQRTRIAIYEEVRKILLYEAESKCVSEGMKKTAALMAETCNLRLENL